MLYNLDTYAFGTFDKLVDKMTFEERCNRFEKLIDNEENLFIKSKMVNFLNEKIEEHNEELKLFGLEEKIKNRPKGSYWKNKS